MSERAQRLRSIAGDRFVRLAATVGLTWVVLYAVLLAVTAGSPSGSTFVQVIVCLGPWLALTITNVVTYRRSTRRKRRLWRVFAISASCVFAGQVLWAVGTYVPTLTVAIDLANLMLIAGLVILVPGYLLAFGGATLIRHARNLVDAGLLAITLGAVGWYVLVMPRLSRNPDFNGWVDIAFVLLDIAVLVSLFFGGLAGHRTVPFSLLVWIAGMVVGAGTDAALSYASLVGPTGDGGWFNLGWQAQAVLLTLGSLIAARHTEPDAQPQLMGRDFSAALVLLPATGVTVVLFWELGRDRLGVLMVVFVMVAGPMLRQLLLIRDRTRLSEALAAALREQERLATTDVLTGVHNRRYFNDALLLEGEQSARTGRPVGVVILDLDHFKRINDSHGHGAGDAVLAEVAGRLRAAVRADDVVARFGGEEFVVLLRDVDEAFGLVMAERLREAVRSEPVRVADGPSVDVSGSFGVAAGVIAQDRLALDLEALVRRADHALYCAKQAGRDRTQVCYASDADPAGPRPLIPSV